MCSQIKKFKDALTKHGTDRCNLGPPKGLDESELLSLASIGEISTDVPLFNEEYNVENLVLRSIGFSGALGKMVNNNMGVMGLEEKKRESSGRGIL